MPEYHQAVLVPVKHVDAVEAYIADLEEIERFRDEHPDELV